MNPCVALGPSLVHAEAPAASHVLCILGRLVRTSDRL